MLRDSLQNLGQLALTDEVPRVRSLSARDNLRHDLSTRRARQLSELAALVGVGHPTHGSVDQNGALTAFRPLKHARPLGCSRGWSLTSGKMARGALLVAVAAVVR